MKKVVLQKVKLINTELPYAKNCSIRSFLSH